MSLQHRVFVGMRSGVEDLWLPVWSLEEMERCRAELYDWVDRDTMRDRYTHFGGVVRFVLAKPTYPFANLMRKLSRAEADRLIRSGLEDVRSDVYYSLAHAQVSSMTVGRFLTKGQSRPAHLHSTCSMDVCEA